ncbi:MAG: amidase, partial [Acidobacteria bacterium]|nr:amidase [Acidobacteriota bacterium]
AWSLDHVGPMTRGARDAALVLECIGEPARKAARPAAKELRLGVPRRAFHEQLDAEVGRAVERAVTVLGRLTAGVREVALPALAGSPQWPDLPLAYARIISAESFAYHREMLKQHPERYHPVTRSNLEGGAAVTAADYILARREMEELRSGSQRLFAQSDLLVTPAAPGPAFELGKPASLVFLRNFAPWNLYGLPSISVPCGFTSGGLPIGLQITGPAGRDEVVLAAAEAYQSVTDWDRKRPPGPA